MSIIINKQNEYITYQVTHLLTREEICDIIFNDYKLREEKLTQKKVDEAVRGHLIIVGLSEGDDIGYHRRNVVNTGGLVEQNKRIVDFVYNKYKLNK